MSVKFVCRFSSKNIGDANCSPLLYYDFMDYVDGTVKIDHKNIKEYKFNKNTTYIVGGGLFIKGNFKNIIQYKNLVAWGIGIRKYIERPNKQIFDSFNNTLIGIRDYDKNGPYHWVPCPSCKHSAFNKKYEVTEEYAIYEHHSKPLNKLFLKYNFPIMTNVNNTMENVIEFLGSAESIITNSYHGMYWATLLGKKVYVLNELNSKIKTFKYEPVYCNSLDDVFSGFASYYTGVLDECREINDNFYKKVLKVV